MEKKLKTYYLSGEDMTIIFRNMYDGEKLLTSEIVGYYHGEPDGLSTSNYEDDTFGVFTDGLDRATREDLLDIYFKGIGAEFMTVTSELDLYNKEDRIEALNKLMSIITKLIINLY